MERDTVSRKWRVGIFIRGEERRLHRQDHLHVIGSIICDAVKIIKQFAVIDGKRTLIELREIANPIAVYKVDRLHGGIEWTGRQVFRKRLSMLIVHGSKTRNKLLVPFAIAGIIVSPENEDLRLQIVP